MPQNPSSMFFWNDWDQEPGLRLCSLAAQGLWMRCLCVMARARPAGYLVIGSRPCTEDELARLINEPQETVAALLDELRRNEVFSITRRGTVYSRRMVRETLLSEKRAKSGRIGGLANQRKIKADRELLKQTGKQNSSNSQATLYPIPLDSSLRSESLSSVSTDDSHQKPLKNGFDGVHDPPWSKSDVKQALTIWCDILGDILPRPRGMTQARSAMLRGRLTDLGGLEGWQSYCQRIRDTPFLMGDGPKGWRACLDWTLKQANMAKTLEGNYDRQMA